MDKPVLVVTPWFPNRPGEREGNFVYDSASAVARLGWKVSVLVSRPWLPWPFALLKPQWQRGKIQINSFDCFQSVQVRRHISAPRNILGRLDEPLANWRLQKAIRKIVAEQEIQIIHAHTEGAAAAAVRAAKHCGIKVAVTLHGINTGSSYFKNKGRRRSIKKALAKADCVVLVGEPIRAFFKEIVGRDDHFRVVENGVRLELAPRSSRPLWNEGFVRFISVSNLHEGKGIEVNIESFRKLRERGFVHWSYTVVGGGNQLTRLTQLVASAQLQENVRFLGARPHSEIPQLLADADVFTLPSYREAFGIAYLEAMAAGLLAIGVEGQGPSQFIEDGVNGVLVPPKNSAVLADRLADILQNTNRYRQIAQTGACHVAENYSWNQHAKKISTLYEEITG